MEQVLKTYGSNGMSQEQNLAALQLYYQHLSEQEEELAKLVQNTKSEGAVLIIVILFVTSGRRRRKVTIQPMSASDARTFDAR